MRLRSGRELRDNTFQMRLRSGRVLRVCLRSGPVLPPPRQTTELSACERHARERRRVVAELLLVVRPEVAVQEQDANAGEPDPELVDPETIIQPAHSVGFIARAAAASMQAQSQASAAARAARRAPARLDPPAQHDDLLAEPAWDWEGWLRAQHELGLPN